MNYGKALALAAVCAGAVAQAASSVTGPKLPALIQELEARYAKAGTLQAEFEQATENKAFSKVKRSRGKISIRRPDQVRWETLSPDPSTLVSDGKKYWLYTPPFDEGESGQVIEKPAKEIKNPFANAILSGALSSSPGLKIKALGKNRFELLPRDGTAGSVKRAEIEIDPAEKTIRRLVLEHKDGNRADITLSKVQLGAAFPADFFTFTPPANTTKVKD